MKVLEDGDFFLVRFEVGEQLPEKLIELAARYGWTSGSITGLGAVKDVVLAYYDLETREYIHHPVDGIVELVSLVGNLSLIEGKPIWHMHISVADRNGNLKGGHLMKLEVAVTVECWIRRGHQLAIRRKDDFSGLNLLDL
jgi:predicted DNA-binding protein with PD1-like motif